MEHDLKVLRQYYDKVLINEYYSTPDIDPDVANKIGGGLILYMNIAEKQQKKSRSLSEVKNDDICVAQS